MAVGTCNEPESTQVLSHALEPKTDTQSLSPPSTLKRKFSEISEGEGDSAQESPYKVLHVNEQIALHITEGQMI